MRSNWIAPLLVVLSCVAASGQAPNTSEADRVLDQYFQQETARLAAGCLADIDSLEQWQSQRAELQRQLRDMLGLDPWPERTDLRAKITGRSEHDGFHVERLHFQSRPGLYVTGNLYLPAKSAPTGQRYPAVLYVCGHGRAKEGGVSYGNKVVYQHHGIWFARHGYACLAIDSLQLGEIEGIHHGTYRYDMWWWLNRGYSPAGVEAWNCVRALDYLQSRPEVDPERLGVTGRSGGGAYSWWIAAIDERVRVAVPVAGITDLQNHVVDGCVEGHCDCMYFVNTYRWDYPLLAALVAPRPLLISNTDRDGIFPLDGVYRTYAKVRRVYELYGAGDKLALNITAGPHKDTQELRVHAFRWFHQHLKNDDSPVAQPATKELGPRDLQVFTGGMLPGDQKNSSIHESFVAAAPLPALPGDRNAWQRQSVAWRQSLQSRVFAGWPRAGEPLDLRERGRWPAGPLEITSYEFTGQSPFRLPLLVVQRTDTEPGSEVRAVDLHVADQQRWDRVNALLSPTEAAPAGTAAERRRVERQLARHLPSGRDGSVLAITCPRGIGPTAWDPDPRQRTQIRRRFYLLGQTLDGMRVWDIRRAVQALRAIPEMHGASLRLHATGASAALAVYASLFEPYLSHLVLHDLPTSHRHGPYLLNVTRYLSLSQALAMAAEQCRVSLTGQGSELWKYVESLQDRLDWPTAGPPSRP
jgi:hypothetical protein